MLDASRLEFLQRLLQAAADDLHRAFTATWSTARLRTLLVHACLDEGHQVIEPGVPGSPANANRGARVARVARPVDRARDRPADLHAIQRDGARALALDLLTGSSAPLDRVAPRSLAVEGTERPGSGLGDNASLSLASAYRSIERVSSGAIDAVLISADARAYEQLFDPVDGLAASRQLRAVAAVLPRAADVARQKAHTCIIGDTTLATAGRDVRAFGLARVACAVYVMPY